MNEQEFRTGVPEPEAQPITESETATVNPDGTPKTDSNLGIDLTGKPTSELIEALEKAANALEARHLQLPEGDEERGQIAQFKAQLGALAEYFLEKLTAPEQA